MQQGDKEEKLCKNLIINIIIKNLGAKLELYSEL